MSVKLKIVSTTMVIIFLLCFRNLFAQETQTGDKGEGGEKVAQNKVKNDKKHYSPKEFHEAVLFEVDKQLKRLGRKKLVVLFNELLVKEQKQKEREAKLQAERKQYEASVKSLEKRILEFENRQKTFISCVDEVESKLGERVTHMVKVLEGMRPANAADVISVQDSNISVKLLEMLPPEKISKIFNLMDKEISARLQKQYMSMKK